MAQRASSAPAMGLNAINSNMFIGICSRSQVGVNRTIGRLVKHLIMTFFCIIFMPNIPSVLIKVLTLKVDISVEKCTGKFDSCESLP